jgi:hypothetical protein
MPTISKPCVDFNKIAEERINYGSFIGYSISMMMAEINARARPGSHSGKVDFLRDDFFKEQKENSLTVQTRLLKSLNDYKRELNARFEREKKDGIELSQKDIDMIYILENTLPDIIINMCQQTRHSNNFKNMGGGKRKTKRSRKNKRTRKHRKV